MKRDELKAHVNKRLEFMGFEPGATYWVPRSSTLLLALPGRLVEFQFKGNMSRRDLSFQIGRLAGYAEMLGLAKYSVVDMPAKDIRAATLSQRAAAAAFATLGVNV